MERGIALMYTMIIVDDEIEFLSYNQKFITHYFPDIQILECFDNGADALAFLQDNSVDIILTDIYMPQMDGLELSKHISLNHPQCVTIIVTGYNSFEYARCALNYNVFSYLLKPLDIEEVLPCIERAKELSTYRKSMHPKHINLLPEKTEFFFNELVSGEFTSKSDLVSSFSSLSLPFTLEESKGLLIRVTIDDFATNDNLLDAEELAHSIKIVLQESLCNCDIYYARHISTKFYYVIVQHDMSLDDISMILDAAVSRSLEASLHTKCNIKIRKIFDSFSDFLTIDQEPHRKIENNKTSNTMIQNAIEYIEKNYDKNISRDIVAAAMYVSPAYFSHQFKEATGLRFIDYLTELRMKKAISLLETNMNINDIITKVGYYSRSTFLSNFKQYTSYTPSEYRQKILQDWRNN